MNKITLYSLSTCIWCKKTRTHLKEDGVAFTEIQVDKLEGKQREEAMEALEKYNPKKSFPTIVFAEDKIVVGFKPEEIREALKKK